MGKAQQDLQRIIGDRFLVIDVAGVLWMHIFLDVEQVEIDGKKDFIIVLKEEYFQKAKEWNLDEGQKLDATMVAELMELIVCFFELKIPKLVMVPATELQASAEASVLALGSQMRLQDVLPAICFFGDGIRCGRVPINTEGERIEAAKFSTYAQFCQGLRMETETAFAKMHPALPTIRDPANIVSRKKGSSPGNSPDDDKKRPRFDEKIASIPVLAGRRPNASLQQTHRQDLQSDKSGTTQRPVGKPDEDADDVQDWREQEFAGIMHALFRGDPEGYQDFDAMRTGHTPVIRTDFA